MAAWQPSLLSAVSHRQFEPGRTQPDTSSCVVLIGGPGQRSAQTLGTLASLVDKAPLPKVSKGGLAEPKLEVW